MLFTHATIVTVDPSRSIFADGAILVHGNRIADIGITSNLKVKHPNEEEIDLTGRIIIPGLISTHMHTAQTLLRGTADDLELVSWLCERIWVLQGNFTAEDGYAAARLSIAEMLLTGTTTFLESMVSIPLLTSRATVLILVSSPTAMASTVSATPCPNQASAAASVRSSWISRPMPKTPSGRCILVSWRPVNNLSSARSPCTRSGTKRPTTASEYGSGLERQAGKCPCCQSPVIGLCYHSVSLKIYTRR
jgi:hypothetical protein